VQALSEVRSKYVVRGRAEYHEQVSTTNGNKNPEEVRPTGLRRGGKVA